LPWPLADLYLTLTPADSKRDCSLMGWD